MFGRPLMISLALSRELALPSAIDDELLTTAPEPPAQQPEDRPSILAFFVEALKLLDFLGEILDAFNVGNIGNKTASNKSGNGQSSHKLGAYFRPIEKIMTGNYQEFLRLDQALTAWQENLPQFLRRTDDIWSNNYASDAVSGTRSSFSSQQLGENKALFTRQANVLRARSVPLLVSQI